MSHLLISAAHKSSGKTTLSIGLCAALRRRGLVVQPFKKGPDYIDPLWLSAAAGRDCHNLDFYTMSHEEIMRNAACYAQGADISLIEANKGLYDGVDVDGSNSNAALANLLNAPVVLVLNCKGMTRGVAPLILGYQSFDPTLQFAGVILNQVGGARHESKLRAVIEHYTDMPILGAVQYESGLNIDERHLGLIPQYESQLARQTIDYIAQRIEEQVDLDAVLAAAATAKWDTVICQPPAAVKADVRLGILRDAAFNFYYAADLDALTAAGAELVFIDALNATQLPDIDGLFIGGGFPETQAAALQANVALREQIKQAVEEDLPVYAECGGLMYLGRSVVWQGQRYSMSSALPLDTRMHSCPQGRGYIRLQETGAGLWSAPERAHSFPAHEFHYSAVENLDLAEPRYAYKVLRGTGLDGQHDGLIYKNTLACYAHLRDVEGNHWTQGFVNFIRRIKQERQ